MMLALVVVELKHNFESKCVVRPNEAFLLIHRALDETTATHLAKSDVEPIALVFNYERVSMVGQVCDEQEHYVVVHPLLRSVHVFVALNHY
jgi:hypothetical protein